MKFFVKSQVTRAVYESFKQVTKSLENNPKYWFFVSTPTCKAAPRDSRNTSCCCNNVGNKKIIVINYMNKDVRAHFGIPDDWTTE